MTSPFRDLFSLCFVCHVPWVSVCMLCVFIHLLGKPIGLQFYELCVRPAVELYDATNEFVLLC